jgi:hypothetical protein
MDEGVGFSPGFMLFGENFWETTWDHPITWIKMIAVVGFLAYYFYTHRLRPIDAYLDGDWAVFRPGLSLEEDLLFVERAARRTPHGRTLLVIQDRAGTDASAFEAAVATVAQETEVAIVVVTRNQQVISGEAGSRVLDVVGLALLMEEETALRHRADGLTLALPSDVRLDGSVPEGAVLSHVRLLLMDRLFRVLPAPRHLLEGFREKALATLSHA